MERYAEGGLTAMSDRGHTAMNRPHAMPERVREALLALRRKHPSWGPKKLKAVLADTMPAPAASSIGELLRREGLVHRKRKRPGGVAPMTTPLAHAEAPNDVWSIAYKG